MSWMANRAIECISCLSYLIPLVVTGIVIHLFTAVIRGVCKGTSKDSSTLKSSYTDQ